MKPGSFFRAAAALLLALLSSTSLAGQDAAAPAPHRVVLSLSGGLPGIHQPPLLSDAYEGKSSIRAAAAYRAGGGLEGGLAYERSRFGPVERGGLTSTLHAISLMGTVLASDQLPLQPFVEIGPSLAIFTDDGEDGTSTVGGVTVGTGIRLRVVERVGAQASASLLVTDGPGSQVGRLFSGLHLGLTLGL